MSDRRKEAVHRHTRFAKDSAHRCEKAIETATRRTGKQIDLDEVYSILRGQNLLDNYLREKLEAAADEDAEDRRAADCDGRAAQREDDDDSADEVSCDRHGRPYLSRFNDAGEPRYWD